jgi:hypothetical protein
LLWEPPTCPLCPGGRCCLCILCRTETREFRSLSHVAYINLCFVRYTPVNVRIRMPRCGMCIRTICANDHDLTKKGTLYLLVSNDTSPNPQPPFSQNISYWPSASLSRQHRLNHPGLQPSPGLQPLQDSNYSQANYTGRLGIN